MASVAGAARSETRPAWVIVQALAGGISAALAWWLTDLLIREQRERLQFAPLDGDASGVLTLLGLTGIGLVSVGIVIWSRAAGVAGGAVLIAGLILGGYGSGRALGLSPGGDLGFILLRGAHEPAIYVLFGAWIGGLMWSFVSARWPGSRPASASATASDTPTID